MPVRRIPPNARSVTGRFPSQKRGGIAHFESTLECDLFVLLEFDPEVRSFEEQPVRIDYLDIAGASHSYTPDVLVTYHAPPGASALRPPELLEVKYENELTARQEELQSRFDAAEAYVLQLGWRFRVVTEKHIRTPRLENARRLLPFRSVPPEQVREARLLSALVEQDACTLGELLTVVASTEEERGLVLPSLWRLIAVGTLEVDLEQRIGHTTLLSLAEAPR